MAASLADWLARQERSHPSAIDLGLTRVREVARHLGLLTPRHRVITVGGTNGKVPPSHSWMPCCAPRSARGAVHLAAPHALQERICIDGVEATDPQLIAAFERIDAARGEISMTFFEYNALAAWSCSRARRRCGVLEVGLGGRLDATNIIDADVAVVCSIGIDHVDWLGHSLEAIGREKAGIFRAHRPAVLGSTDMPDSVFAAIATLGAKAWQPGRDYHVQRHAQSWDFSCGTVHLRNLPLPALAGARQIDNAATALAALVAMPGDFANTVTSQTVAGALREVRIRGRFQVIPVTSSGCSTWPQRAAAKCCAPPGSIAATHTIAVCGVLGDKDIAGITATLAPAIDAWVLTRLEGPRAVPASELAACLPADAVVLAQAEDVAAACRVARAAAAPGQRIVVFGSFLTVGPALEFLGI